MTIHIELLISPVHVQTFCRTCKIPVLHTVLAERCITQQNENYCHITQQYKLTSNTDRRQSDNFKCSHVVHTNTSSYQRFSPEHQITKQMSLRFTRIIRYTGVKIMADQPRITNRILLARNVS